MFESQVPTGKALSKRFTAGYAGPCCDKAKPTQEKVTTYANPCNVFMPIMGEEEMENPEQKHCAKSKIPRAVREKKCRWVNTRKGKGKMIAS